MVESDPGWLRYAVPRSCWFRLREDSRKPPPKRRLALSLGGRAGRMNTLAPQGVSWYNKQGNK
jgi:hypothetical protein